MHEILRLELCFAPEEPLPLQLWPAVVGPPGPPGSGGTSGALLIDNRLNEYAADPAAQQQARDNLGIPPNTPAPTHIDGGSF